MFFLSKSVFVGFWSLDDAFGALFQITNEKNMTCLRIRKAETESAFTELTTKTCHVWGLVKKHSNQKLAVLFLNEL